jgi:two-component system chemotaxis response regulator CheY
MEKKGVTILVVDDDVNVREMYAEVFRAAGFQVLEANDGVDGLDRATKEMPSIIFTGIVMPRMDGFSMIEELKKNVSTANIPVMISSHMGREEDQKRANLLGVEEFIVLGMTQPSQVVEKIKSMNFQGGVYRLNFDPIALDAQKLAKDLRLNDNFQCLECNEKMILEIRAIKNQEIKLEARIVCPNCGWSVK